MGRFAVTALLVWGVVTLGSCSAERLGRSSDGNADSSPWLDSGGVDQCSGSLSDVGGGCPASFDGTVADLPACSAGEGQQVQRLCGGVIALGQGGGFTGLTCYYDGATHLLVGALESTDDRGFCGGTSFGRAAGQIPRPSCDIEASFSRTCSLDAGAG